MTATAQAVEIPSQRHQPLSGEENRLKKELRFDDAAVDDDTRDVSEMREKKGAMRRNSSQLEIPVLAASESALGELQMRRKSIESETRGDKIIFKKIPKIIIFLHLDSSPDRSGIHQVTETASDAQHTSFVIPKIIVETQVDMAEASTTATTTIMAYSPDEIAAATNVDADTPEKPLNQKMEKHSRDNNGATPAVAVTTKDNNSPVMEVESSIYHYGKQQEQQHHHTSELQKLADMKISGDNDEQQQMKGVTVTHADDDDGKNRHSLNDKIGEIYRKIERIEGEYYDEKEKIIENFEKRASCRSSPTHQPSTPKNADGGEASLNELELQENWSGAQVEFNYSDEPDKQQTFNDDDVVTKVEEPAGTQSMFESNEYASETSKTSHDGGELQANFVENPLSSEEMQYQQQQEYYANVEGGYEQQQQPVS